MVSYWHGTLDRPALAGDGLPARARAVVVGGGVLGACAALWLARAGAAPLLIERAGPAAGASGHNGGLLVSGLAESYPAAIERLGHATARALYGLTLEGQRLMADLVAEERIACDLRLTGNLGLAVGEAQLAGMAATVAALRADGLPGELLDRQAAQGLVGTPLGPEIVGAKLNPAAGALHSGRLVHGLLAAARRHGATLCWGVTLRDVAADGAGMRLETSGGPVLADAALLAVNAWTGELAPELAAKIRMVRGQALSTAPVAPLLAGGFGVSLTPTGEYGQQAPDGRVIFGGCRALAPGRDVGAPAGEVSAEVQAGLDAGLGRVFPALAGVAVERRWSGPMAFTDDYLPIVASPRPGLYLAGGFSGHGMPYAAIVGRLLAEAALGGGLPAALAPLGPTRPSAG